MFMDNVTKPVKVKTSCEITSSECGSAETLKESPIQSLELAISTGVQLLKAGQCVAIPTETVYGLAAAINDHEAIANVFKIKQRPFFDPLIVHICSMEMLPGLAAEISPLEAQLMRRFWPGPLTLVVSKSSAVDPLICAGLDTVAVRMPAHPVALKIIEGVGAPLAAPSANRFGRTSPTLANHVACEWPEEEVFVVDGGPCQIGIESTVVAVESQGGTNTVKILRPGIISAADLAQAASDFGIEVRVEAAASISSPGHLPFHYQPAIPLVSVPSDRFPLSPTDLAAIVTELKLESDKSAHLALDNNPAIAARQLYSEMRRLADSGAAFLTVLRPDCNAEPQWTAIWDRLQRASSLHLGL